MSFTYWTIGMTTAPRSTPTIRESILSVRDAGWPEVFVMAEPDSPRPQLPGIKWAYHKERVGPWTNFRHLLGLMLNVTRWPSLFLMLQDDIRITSKLRGYLEHDKQFESMIRSADFGVASLYLSAENADRFIYANGWDRYPEHTMPHAPHGALAYVFTRESAENLLSNPPNPEADAGIERQIARWCKRESLRYWSHNPSFIMHTGGGLSTLDRGESGLESCRQAGRFAVIELDGITITPATVAK